MKSPIVVGRPLTALAVATLLLTTGCDGPTIKSTSLKVADTQITLTIAADGREHAARSLSGTKNAVRATAQQLLSTESDFDRLARTPAGTPTGLSAEAFSCLQIAQQVHNRTNGALDVTASPLRELWLSPNATRAPSQAMIDRARSRVGMDALQLDLVDLTVSRARDDLSVDPGPIALGRLLDRAASQAGARGATGVLATAAGQAVARGSDVGQRPWELALRHPLNDGIYARLTLTDGALATVQNALNDDGTVLAIDPRTARPVEAALSVTVIHTSAAEAAAWAGALAAMPYADAKQFAKTNEIDALFIAKHADDLQPAWTGNFAEHVIDAVVAQSALAGAIELKKKSKSHDEKSQGDTPHASDTH